MKDGVHFNMPFDEYLAINALSASGLKQMLKSPHDYWWSTPWNSLRDEVDTDTPALRTGRAYHARICEAATFKSRYGLKFDPGMYPEALNSIDALKEACRERDLKVGGTKAVLSDRLRECPDAPELMEDHRCLHVEELGERIPLDFPLMARIELAAKALESHPQLHNAFSGGAPEVTILFHIEVTLDDGEIIIIPCKSRCDYLKPKAIVDLKTFANQMSMPVERAVIRAITTYKYFIQAEWYLRAVEAAAKIPSDCWHDAPDNAADILENPDKQFLFIFQQTAPSAPVTVPKLWDSEIAFGAAGAIVEELTRTWAEKFQKHGEEPWINQAPITKIVSEEIPDYAWN